MEQRIAHAVETSSLADVLERVLDKGIVIAGDIKKKRAMTPTDIPNSPCRFIRPPASKYFAKYAGFMSITDMRAWTAAMKKPIKPQNLMTTSLSALSSSCQRMILPMRYEQATKMTAANDVALLSMNSGK